MFKSGIIESDQPGSPARHHQNISWLLIVGVLCLFTAFLYRDTLSIYFLGDDLGFLNHVAKVAREGRSLSHLSDEILSPPHRGGFFYRPLTVASFLGDYLLHGANSAGWHFTSLLLHLVNIVLLWRFVESVAGGSIDRGATIAGGAAAAFFALRPSSPETVVWLSGRNDELVLAGFLIALVAYHQAEGRWGGSYLLAIGGFLLALGSKESGVTFPGGLLALHVAGAIPIHRKSGESYRLAWFRSAVKGIGPFALLLLIYFVWRLFLFGSPFKVYQEVMPMGLNDPEWWTIKLGALRFFLAPATKTTPLSVCMLMVAFVQALIGFAASLRWPEVRRLWVFGGCWLLAGLLPLTQQLLIAPTGEGARLLYIPGAALAVLLAAPLAGVFKSTGDKRVFCRVVSTVGLIGMAALIILSLPLLNSLLRPWLEAGRSMKNLTSAIAVRADRVPKGGFAALLVPDHVEGALFARNGQGALMEPPVQRQSLRDRVLVMTPPTVGHHGSRLASFSPNPLLEHWCWNLEGQRFERLRLREHSPGTWPDAWRSALRDSDCRMLANQFEMLYP